MELGEFIESYSDDLISLQEGKACFVNASAGAP